jgi:hypothetical protein
MIHWLTDNLQWKALSLLIAVLLWSIVVGEPELVTSQSVPIFYKNLPRDLEIGADAPDRVHLEIRGPSGKLTPAALTDTAIMLDLSTVQSPGERTFTVVPNSMNLPIGVAFLRAVPSQLRLRFDRLVAKDVIVQVRTIGTRPSGYHIVREEVIPPKLRIVGPENHVTQVESAQTDPIDLASTYGHAEFRVHAYVADPQVRFDSSPIVTVRVTMQKGAGK